MNTAVPVTDLLDECEDVASSGLTADVKIEDQDSFPSSLHVHVPRWKRVFDVVAVVGDMKNSTGLSFREHPKTSAKAYEAITGNMVRILDYYEPNFVDIQGDGVFGLYHGELAHERALCAAISMITFSRLRLMQLLEEHLPGVPPIGIKTGMAVGTITAKRVGIRGTEEPVWAGKPVNWAVKCAQTADVHELVATKKVFNHFQVNDWVKWSCGCRGGIPNTSNPELLWQTTTVPPLGNELCFRLESYWCPNCGDEFHEAILEGEKKRNDIPSHYS